MDNSYLVVLCILILISLIIYVSYKLNNYSIIYYSFIILIWSYYIYLIYIYNSSDPNRPDVLSESFSNTFNNIYEFTVPTLFKETSMSENEYASKSHLITNAYKLGFRLELGLPSEKWIAEASSKLQSLGEKEYYTELYKANLNRIKSSTKSKITIHDTDTMGESVYLYNSFDIIESIRDNHLYTYSRPNWDWLLKHKICLWTREPLSRIVLKNIEYRKKIAQYLPIESFIFPIDISEISVNSENVKNLSDKSAEIIDSNIINKNMKKTINSSKYNKEYSQSERIIRSF